MEKQPEAYYVTIEETFTIARDKTITRSYTRNLCVVVMSKKEIPALLESIGITDKQTFEHDGELFNVTHEVLKTTLLDAGLHFGDSVLKKSSRG